MTVEPLSEDEKSNVARVIDTPFRSAGEKFHVLLDDLVYLICEAGIDAVRTDPTAPFDMRRIGLRRRRVFFKKVHAGWKNAQARILMEMHELMRQKASHEVEATEAHIRKNAEAKRLAKLAASLCAWKVHILRRFLDAICWNILKGEHHVIRRLHQDRVPGPPSVSDIAHIWPTVMNYNANPFQIAIVADATTFIGTCDLLASNVRTRTTAFIELKSGSKNVAMSRAARFAVESGCERFEKMTLSAMDAVDRKHFSRAKRQIERLASVRQIIETGEGIDHRTGGVVRTPEVPFDVSLYADRVTALVNAVGPEKGWAIDVIEKCLYVGVYRDREMMGAFFAWVRGKGRKGRVYNLLESFQSYLSRPLAALALSPSTLRRLLRCELNILLYLDVEAWISEVNRIAGEDSMFLESRVASRKLMASVRGFMPAVHDGQLIGLRSDVAGMQLGQGALDRIFFDLQSPLNVALSSLSNLSTIAKE